MTNAGSASVDLADRISIATPEGVTLELTLAGLGSRLVAGLIDLVLQGLFIFVMVIFAFAFAAAGESGFLIVTLVVIISLLALVGYPTLMEALSDGQTLGKKVAGIRVLGVEGKPASVLQVVLRNVFRIVDLLPGAYAVGVISIMATRHLQRVGDLVGGTIVVRIPKPTAPRGVALGVSPGAATWDVSQVTEADLTAIRTFIDRAPDLDPPVRAAAADRMATAILPRVVATERAPSAELFLRRVLVEKTGRT
ncbi:MAG: RDD family protein [Acidimicrobiia bacterium]|nr:RDD family protein [Acidimicrobiia bacterium]